MEKSTEIKLIKSRHRDKVIMLLKFTNREDWLIKIKQLENVLFSKTLKAYYLPYDKESYKMFLNLNLPFTPIDANGTDSLPSNNISLSKREKDHSERDLSKNTSPKLERQEIEDIYIPTRGNVLFIRVRHSVRNSKFFKSINRSYWNIKHGKWVIPFKTENLRKIQNEFVFWDNEQYLKLIEQASEIEDPSTVTFYRSPEYVGMYLMKLAGNKASTDILVQDSRISQLHVKGIWTFTKNKELLEALILHFKKLECHVINRVESIELPATKIEQRKEQILKYAKKNHHHELGKYMESLKVRGYKWKTVSTYTNKMIAFANFSSVDLTIRSNEIINDFFRNLIRKEMTESSLHIYASAIRYYYKHVTINENVEVSRIIRPKKRHTLPKFISKQQVYSLLSAIKNRKHSCLAATLYSTGVRLNELRNIRIEHIYWDRNQILIKNGKGGKDRMVQLSTVVKDMLKEYFHNFNPVNYLFEGNVPGTQYSSSSIQKIIRTAARNASIRQKVTPHTLRHSYATHLMDGGIDTRFIQVFLGHKDIRTTLIYTHVTNRNIEEIQSPLDSLPKITSEKRNKR